MRLTNGAAGQRVIGLLAMALAAIAMAACTGGAEASGANPLAGLSEGQMRALGQGAGSVSALHGTGNGITVTGTGLVSIEPEFAVLSLGVEETADTVAEARAGAAAAMNAMLTAIRDAGVADDDIETQQFRIRAEYRNISGEQRLDGFRVTNTLTVKVRDMDAVGDVIDRAAEAGGDATRINNITFTIEEGGEAENEARRLAVQDAVAKAELYAAELGLDRGGLLSLTETGSQFPRSEQVRFLVTAAYDGAGSASTPIQPGEFDVVVTVEAVFGIQ
ncbi:MAG: SIMPL domain-containing protein [Dehalococcoidia bacterium]